MSETSVPNTPFFIVGTDRSGSTMLRLMLNQHPDILVPRETWFFIVLMEQFPLNTVLTEKQVRAAYDLIRTDRPRRWQDLEIDDQDLLEKLLQLESPRLSDVIDCVMNILMQREHKSIWADKTPEYLVHIEKLHQVFPKARFIHIIRDGRDVCLSLLRKGWRGSNVRKIADYWSQYVSKGVESGRRLPGELYLEIMYEDLVLDTENSLKKICAFLDVEYNKKMKDFHEESSKTVAKWEKTHHLKTMRAPRTSDVMRWKIEMSKFKIVAFEAVAGRTMDLVNQSRYYNGISRSLPALFSVINKLAEISLPIRNKLRLHFPNISKNV